MCVCVCVCVCVVSPERMKLKRTDYPLVLRVMQGPCEQVCRVFLMEPDLGEEVTYDVRPRPSLLRGAETRTSDPHMISFYRSKKST